MSNIPMGATAGQPPFVANLAELHSLARDARQMAERVRGAVIGLDQKPQPALTARPTEAANVALPLAQHISIAAEEVRCACRELHELLIQIGR